MNTLMYIYFVYSLFSGFFFVIALLSTQSRTHFLQNPKHVQYTTHLIDIIIICVLYLRIFTCIYTHNNVWLISDVKNGET